MTNPTMPTEPRILFLERVSTDTQDVSRQCRDRDFIQQRDGVKVERTYALEGVSGTLTYDHPDVQAMFKELENPAYVGLGLSSIDRLFRPDKPGDFKILDPFIEHKKGIYSKLEGTVAPWTPAGWRTCMEAGIQAGMEWRKIRDTSLDGKIRLAVEDNVMSGGSAAYGYRYVRGRRCGTWKIYEPEAKIVREIFRQHAVLGWTAYRISKWLNEEKISAQKGGLWSPPVVRQILYNPCYVGNARYIVGKPRKRPNRRPRRAPFSPSRNTASGCPQFSPAR